MANLMESYKGRLAICEKYYSQHNNGAKLDSEKKMVVAQCLDNTARYINEGYANSIATQRSALGDYKRFCMDITTITMPNMIVNDLFIVKPIASFQGYLTYMEFALGTAKGGIEEGKEVIQNPFVYNPMTEARMRYTGEAVVEAVEVGNVKPAWGPVVKGAFYNEGDKQHYDVKVMAADGSFIKYANLDAEGKIVISEAGKIAYKYDNQIVPQDKLPTLIGRMKGIELTARARRIAIEYSQFAAFQS